MVQEAKATKTAHFLTLTYDPDHIPMVMDGDELVGHTLDKHDLWKFHIGIKQYQRRKLGTKLYTEWKIRYYSVGEYGSKTQRPHYHSIIYNVHPLTINAIARGEIWGKGIVHIGSVQPESCAYVAKYLIDKEEPTNYERQKPFTVMSRRPGIGANYLETHRSWHRNLDGEPRYYTEVNGKKGRLPRYYKDKLFTKLEKQKWADIAQIFADDKYREQIEKILATHEDADAVYEERLRFHHEQIRIKSLKLNSI